MKNIKKLVACLVAVLALNTDASQPKKPSLLDAVTHVEPIKDIIRGYLSPWDIVVYPHEKCDRFAFSPDNKYLVTAGAGVIYKTDRTTRQRTFFCNYQNDFGFIYSLSFSPDSKYLVVIIWLMGDSLVELYDFESGKFVKTLTHSRALRAVFTDDKKYVITIGSEYMEPVKIWHFDSQHADFCTPVTDVDVFTYTSQWAQTISGFYKQIPKGRHIDYQPQAKIFLAADDQGNSDSDTMVSMFYFSGFPGMRIPFKDVACAAFGPAGQLLIYNKKRITISDATLFGIKNGKKEYAYFERDVDGLREAVVSPDSRFIALLTEKNISVIDRDANTIAEIPNDNYSQIAFSPDGKYLALINNKQGIAQLEFAVGNSNKKTIVNK